MSDCNAYSLATGYANSQLHLLKLSLCIELFQVIIIFSEELIDHTYRLFLGYFVSPNYISVFQPLPYCLSITML
jgi:hypothetical protein